MGDPTKRMPFEYSNRWPQLGKEMGLTDEVIQLLDARDQELENWLSSQPIIFDHDAGTVALRSKPWTAKTFGRVKEWSIELDMEDDGTEVVADGDLVFGLHIDGVEKAELTIPDGEIRAEFEGTLPMIPKGGRITILDSGDGVDYNYVSTVLV